MDLSTLLITILSLPVVMFSPFWIPSIVDSIKKKKVNSLLKSLDFDKELAIKLEKILYDNQDYCIKTELYKYAESNLSPIARSLYIEKLHCGFASTLLSTKVDGIYYFSSDKESMRNINTALPFNKKAFSKEVVVKFNENQINIFLDKDFLSFVSKSLQDLKVNFPDLLASTLNIYENEINDEQIYTTFIVTYLKILNRHLIDYLIFIDKKNDFNFDIISVTQRLKEYEKIPTIDKLYSDSKLPNFCEKVIDINKEIKVDR